MGKLPGSDKTVETTPDPDTEGERSSSEARRIAGQGSETKNNQNKTDDETVKTVELTYDAARIDRGVVSLALTDAVVDQVVTLDQQRVERTDSHQQATRAFRTDVHVQGGVGQSTLETFRQSQSGVVDILVVIDNSKSMLQEQANLSTKLVNLLTHIGDADWQIGVVTTDPDEGCLRGLIRKSDADPEQSFASAVTAGNGGSNNERGIKSAVDGLKGECLVSPWLRDDSSVAVLVVSDEDNCNTQGLGCPDVAWNTENYLLNYLSAIRTPGVDARFYALIWHPSDDQNACSTADFQGEAYARAVDATGGAWGSVCDTDYSSTLEAISDNIAETLKDQFSLTHAPTMGTVSIKVDGIPMASGYQISGSTITFSEPPADNAIVDIAYEYGTTPMTDRYAVTDDPDPDTLSVLIDGIPTSNYTLDRKAAQVVMGFMPPAGADVKLSYRVNQQLSKSFSLSHAPITDSVVVYVDGVEVTSYTVDSYGVRFASPPSDGSEIELRYEIWGEPVLDYPISIPERIDLSSVAVTDRVSGDPIDAEVGHERVAVDAEDFLRERQVLVSYHDAVGIPDVVTLSEEPLAGSVEFFATDNVCTDGEIDVNGTRIDFSQCGINRSLETIEIRYDFIAEWAEDFKVELPDDFHEVVDWRVLVDGEPVSAFSVLDNVISGQFETTVDSTITVILNYRPT